MKLPIFQIDAFSHKVFRGNPACVVPLENWLKDEVLLNIAQENADKAALKINIVS